ncbi:MAG: amylo-alpha-1,6-glucosidase [Saprospiraceae bacterium]
MLTFDNPTFEALSEKEWLVTNGLGGYASSTISGANTRRYHGLLVASLRPPTERTVIVSKVEEKIIDENGDRIDLSSNQYKGVVHPQGYTTITSFKRDPLPVTTFKGKGWKLTKTVFMVNHSNTTVVEYQNLGKKTLTLQLNPFYVYRDYHSLFAQQDKFDFYRDGKESDIAVIYPQYGSSPLYVQCPGSDFKAERIWYKNFIYAKETYRGLDDHEDACSNGVYSLQLAPGQKAHIVFTLDQKQLNQSWVKLQEEEIARIVALTDKKVLPAVPGLSKEDQQFYKDLVTSGDQFIVQRDSDDGRSIIAGYHWFTDWGRDTMIAMRGLVIAGGQQALAKNIINTFLLYLKDGLIPNRFPDQGETPEYNTIDASLWLFIVLHEYHQKFNDTPFIAECLPKLKQILTSYRDGTHFKIHMVEEGLIFGGEGLSQLTWMDAKVGDYVVTPRHGCPVEINVLWYNAIRIYLEFQKSVKQKDDGWNALSIKVREAFRKHFLNTQGYLNDVVIPGEYADDAIRPNQVYALSLPYSMLTDEESKSVMQIITSKLFTPFGLRSLSSDHPDFIGIYGGDQWHRDKAYHQGTVWGFLLGEYLIAYLKLNDNSAKAKKQVFEMMGAMKDHFYHADCIHGISEIFDGANPGPGRGCVQQAWSIGMLLLVFDSMKKENVSVTPQQKQLPVKDVVQKKTQKAVAKKNPAKKIAKKKIVKVAVQKKPVKAIAKKNVAGKSGKLKSVKSTGKKK